MFFIDNRVCLIELPSFKKIMRWKMKGVGKLFTAVVIVLISFIPPDASAKGNDSKPRLVLQITVD